MEKSIEIEIKKIKICWKVVRLIIAIEKFDSEWPSLQLREFATLDTFGDYDCRLSHKISESIVDAFAGNVDPIKLQALANFKDLMTWYETEIGIPNLIKCLLIRCFMHFVLPESDLFLLIGSELTTSLLIECGYNWVCFLKMSYPRFQEVNYWLFDCLSDLRDNQETIRRKFDLYGAGSKLTMPEKLLIHIIGKQKGISTGSIVNKIGKSEATVRRMLAKLRQRNLIVSFGKGRATFHRVLEVGY